MFVRSDLAASIKEIARTNVPIGVEVLWLRFSGILPGGRALLLGAAYCSPQGSSVYGCSDGSGLACGDVPDAVFGSITGELDRLRREGDEILLAGDFNARTASILELPEAFTGVGHPRLKEPRDSIDTGVNCFGRRLIEMSKETGLAIVNGRTPTR